MSNVRILMFLFSVLQNSRFLNQKRNTIYNYANEGNHIRTKISVRNRDKNIGEDCQFPDDCGEGLRCHNPILDVPGICNGWLNVDGWVDACSYPCHNRDCLTQNQCEERLECVRFLGYTPPDNCVEVRKVGEQCDDQWGLKCEEGLTCYRPYNGLPTCQSKGGLKMGEECDDQQGLKCEEGLTCYGPNNGLATCRRKGSKELGEACDDQPEFKCEDGLICFTPNNGLATCRSKGIKKLGEECDDQQGLKCEEGLTCYGPYNGLATCHSKGRKLGEECDDQQGLKCEEGLECYGPVKNGLTTCQRIKQLGDTCDAWPENVVPDECRSGPKNVLATCRKCGDGLICFDMSQWSDMTPSQGICRSTGRKQICNDQRGLGCQKGRKCLSWNGMCVRDNTWNTCNTWHDCMKDGQICQYLADGSCVCKRYPQQKKGVCEMTCSEDGAYRPICRRNHTYVLYIPGGW